MGEYDLDRILVGSGFCNKILQTGCIRNNRYLFLETGKSKIQVLADSVSGGGHFLVHRCLLTITLYGGRDEGSPWGLSYRGTNPIHEGSPS